MLKKAAQKIVLTGTVNLLKKTVICGYFFVDKVTLHATFPSALTVFIDGPDLGDVWLLSRFGVFDLNQKAAVKVCRIYSPK